MGLLDNLGGQLAGQMAGQALGGNSGGANLANMVGPLLQMLGGGGLSSLIGTLTSGGLGNIVQSWVGTGANMPVDANQLGAALGGSDILGKLMAQTGLAPDQLHGALAGVLPQLVDQLTPSGQLPAPDAAMPDATQMLSKIFGG